MALYQSDITRFLNDLKAQKPQLDEDQRKGRAIWWDKTPLPTEDRARAQAARVKQKSYVYFS